MRENVLRVSGDEIAQALRRVDRSDADAIAAAVTNAARAKAGVLAAEIQETRLRWANDRSDAEVEAIRGRVGMG